MMEEENNLTITVEDIEKIELEKIQDLFGEASWTLWGYYGSDKRDEEDMEDVYPSETNKEDDNQKEKERLARILEKNFPQNSFITDMLKAEQFSSLYEISDLIGKISRPELKVFLYNRILNSDQYLKDGRDLEELVSFLGKYVNVIKENTDPFQNISSCESIIEGHKREENSPNGYLEIEKDKLEHCIKENTSDVKDLSKEVRNYEGLKAMYLGNKSLKKILVDLNSRKESFNSQELISISHAIQVYEIIKKKREEIINNPNYSEKTKQFYLSGNNMDSVLSNGSILKEYFIPAVDLIEKRIADVKDLDKGLFVKYVNLITAASIGHTEFLNSKLGNFYEEFEEKSKNFSPESRAMLLGYLLDIGDQYNVISWEITKNVFEDLKNQDDIFPETLRSKYVFMDSWGQQYNAFDMLKSSRKSDFIRTKLLLHCYEDSSAGFVTLCKRLIYESDDAEQYVNKLLEEKGLPKDFVFTTLSYLSFKQLKRGDIDDFKKNISKANEIVANISDKNSTLVYLYSLMKGMDCLTRFTNAESNPPKGKDMSMESTEIRNPRERRQLCLYIKDRIKEQADAFSKLLDNEDVLEQLELGEIDQFFTDVTAVLTAVIYKDLNKKVMSYLERRLEKYMEYFRRNPNKFFTEIDGCRIGTPESMHQLFAALGILAFSDDIKDIVFIMKKNGEVKLSSYGRPVFNRHPQKSLRDIEQTSETKRLGEKYAQFIWEMIKDTKMRNSYIDNTFAFNFKHPSAFCLEGPNRQILNMYHYTDSRYHLNGIVFPYLRKQREKEDGKK